MKLERFGKSFSPSVGVFCRSFRHEHFEHETKSCKFDNVHIVRIAFYCKLKGFRRFVGHRDGYRVNCELPLSVNNQVACGHRRRRVGFSARFDVDNNPFKEGLAFYCFGSSQIKLCAVCNRSLFRHRHSIHRVKNDGKRVFNGRLYNRKFIVFKNNFRRKRFCPRIGVFRRSFGQVVKQELKLFLNVFTVEVNRRLRSVRIVDNCRIFNGRLAERGTKLDARSDFGCQIELIIAQPPTKKAVGVFCRSFLRNLRNVLCFENEAFAVSACNALQNFTAVVSELNAGVQNVEGNFAFRVYRVLQPRFSDMKHFAHIFAGFIVVRSEITVDNNYVAVLKPVRKTSELPTGDMILICIDFTQCRRRAVAKNRIAVTNQNNGVCRYRLQSRIPRRKNGDIVFR